MKSRVITLFIILLLLMVNIIHLSGQEKFSIGWHINPIVSINLGKTKGTLSSTQYKLFDIGLQTGIEINYSIRKNIILTPALKYYRVSQKIINSDFKDYLTNESYVWQKISYENIDMGLLTKFRISKKSLFTFGLMYSLSSNNLLKWRNHYRGNDNTNSLVAIGYKFNPNDIGTKNNMFKICLGLRNLINVKKIGLFEYGVLLYIPTKSMPAYRYDQILETTSGQVIDYSNFTSNQISSEVCLIYKFINYDKNYKRLKRNKLVLQ